MRCPFCHHPDSRVIDSREVEDGQTIRRRRSCPECTRRFTTVEEAVLAVVKRSGVTEPFSRTKVVDGVRRACQGRPVNEDDLAQLAQQVEDTVRAAGAAELPSQEIGLAILGPLRDLDEVAYLRFASVYRAFTSADDFMAEIESLRADHPRPPGPDGNAGGNDGVGSADDAVGADPEVADRGDSADPVDAVDGSGAAAPPGAEADAGPPGRRQPVVTG